MGITVLEGTAVPFVVLKNAIGIETKAVHQFASFSNPGTHVFMDKMKDLIQIYNHTEKICFDDKHIYLIADESVQGKNQY